MIWERVLYTCNISFEFANFVYSSIFKFGVKRNILFQTNSVCFSIGHSCSLCKRIIITLVYILLICKSDIIMQ